jgi:hypothetical protein
VRVRKRCTFEGCTKGAIKGGVCVTHGATRSDVVSWGVQSMLSEEESALHMAQRWSLNVVASRDVSI